MEETVTPKIVYTRWEQKTLIRILNESEYNMNQDEVDVLLKYLGVKP